MQQASWRSRRALAGFAGLDAAAAFFIISALRTLASQGRSIFMSIHQPAAEIFDLFDQLLLLSGGEMIYFGPAEKCATASCMLPVHAQPATAQCCANQRAGHLHCTSQCHSAQHARCTPSHACTRSMHTQHARAGQRAFTRTRGAHAHPTALSQTTSSTA
jgi:ABC-type multidrug transport system ATPase subunit